MDRDVLGMRDARSALTSVKGSAKGSPRSLFTETTESASKTYSTRPTLHA